MRVAFIRPMSLLHQEQKDSYHLALVHLLQSHTNYRKAFQEAPGWKILDNGIAESVRFNPSKLFDWAEAIKADEIVVPDELSDYQETIVKAAQFKVLAEQYPEFKYMGVIQGKSDFERFQVLEAFEYLGYMSSYALPRCMNMYGFSYARFQFACEMKRRGLSLDNIHCLGSSHLLDEVSHLKSLHLRGIDTCAPLVLAVEGRVLGASDRLYKGRPGNYFEWVPDEKGKHLVRHNCKVFNGWAGNYPVTDSIAGGYQAPPTS